MERFLTNFSSIENQKVTTLYLSCGFLLVAILLIDLSLPLGVAGGVPYIAVVLLSLWFPQRRYTLLLAVISSLLTIAGFFYSPQGGELWKVIFNRSLALFAIWITAIFIIQRKGVEQKHEDAGHGHEPKSMKIWQGFLTICASCKKVRDDEGNWKQIETYIKKHAQVEFSHGICDQCCVQLYGKAYYQKIKDRLEKKKDPAS